MPLEQYWLGKGLNLDEIWEDFDNGSGYIAKVESVQTHLLRLVFNGHPKHLPLFDHEAIYKTIKGTFHDVKAECLSPQAYDAAAPIFLYRIDRGSGVFEFLAELQPLFPYVAALGAAMMWYRRANDIDQESDERSWKFIRSNFPRVGDSDLAAYMKARTTWGKRRILARLIQQGLHRVEVSTAPISRAERPKSIEMVVVIDISQPPDRDVGI